MDIPVVQFYISLLVRQIPLACTEFAKHTTVNKMIFRNLLTTPAVEKIKGSNSAGNGGASSGHSKTNKALCHDLLP